MPIEFENSSAGATDISGMSEPARTPSSLAADTKKKQNQNERRPKAQAGGNPLQGVEDALGGAAQQVGKGVDTAGKWLADQGFAQPKPTANPIDWAKEFEQDASVPWGWARHAYSILSDTYHDGVHGLYASDTGQAKVLQAGADFLAESIPTIGLQMTAQDLVSDYQAMAGQKTEQQRQQEVAQHSEQGAQDAPGRAGDVATMAAGGVAGSLAQLGLPLMESLLGGDVDEQHSALAWAGVAGVLSFAHLPEPARKVLLDRFGDWPGVEKALQAAVDRKQHVNRNFQDPHKRVKQTTDWIAKQLEKGGLPARATTVAKAAKPGEAQRVAAEITPEGAIKVLPSEGRKNIKKLLNRIGVEDVDALVHKAQNEGINDPKLVKQIIKNWKDLGQTYDLQRFHAEEMPLRDPRRHLDDLADQQVGQKHVSAINHYLDQIHRGLFANSSDPMQAILRALAGHSRATRLSHEQWMSSLVSLVGDKSLTEDGARKLMQAAEGDVEAYEALRPEEKMVVDGWGLLRAATREVSQGTDYADNFLPNWVPRTDREAEDMLRGRGRPSTASVLAREARLHREEAIRTGPDGQLVVTPRFATVSETNKGLADARSNLIATLTKIDQPLSAELMNDPEARAIRELVAGDPAQAMERARKLAAQKYPDKETNFLLNVNRVFAQQVRAVHTHQALQEFTQMLAKDGKAAAIKLRPGANRQREEFLRQGYQQLSDPRFQGFVFHPDLATNLSRYVNHVSKGLRDAPGWKQALALEGKAVAAIMFAPPVHGLNVAGRMGIAGLMHPLQMLSYMKDGKALLPHQWDDESWALRSEAYNAGVVPHHRGKSYADNLLSQMQDALGDVEEPMAKATKSDTMKNRLGAMWDNVARPHRWVNQHFWGLVNDFGVMMYHLEKTQAQRAGLDDAAAMEYAGRRANTWMGMVAPEDTNPMVHDLSRLVLFAPNWWRTWGELMVPLYRRAGFTHDPAYAKFAAMQSAKTVAATLAWQKMTGELLNYALSGHSQQENQPGNQDRIEATAPWLDHLPGFSGVAATDPKTGARRTIENPLARQQLATEGAVGLQSGHADYRPQDTWDGMTKFLAARISPLLDSTMALGNVDLYQSVADHQLRAVDPMLPAGSISPASLLYGSIMMTPIGQQFSQQVQRNVSAGDTNPVESALGTQIPGSLAEAVKDIGDPVGRTSFSWVTGTNAPYASAQRTRGIKPSDQDYQRAKQLNDEYKKQMTVLSAQALSGQMTPSQWRKAYVDLSRQHSAQMEALFKNSPEYVNGAQGMAAQWEELYQKATKDDGSLDQEHLAQLQAQFKQERSADQMQQMQAILRQNDSRFPMLKLYHASQRQFDDWQNQWAVQHNVDVNQLRREASEYGALFGDSRQQNQYLRQHPELRAYENAKKREFQKTPAGMLHSLFYGNNAAVNRYLRARHQTAAEFIGEEAQAS